VRDRLRATRRAFERNHSPGRQPLPNRYRRFLARVVTARRIKPKAEPPREHSLSFDPAALSLFANLPLRARLANQFTDAMLAMEEALSMCEVEREACRDASWIEGRIKATYDQVNALMASVAD